jgi:hypothetical protein
LLLNDSDLVQNGVGSSVVELVKEVVTGLLNHVEDQAQEICMGKLAEADQLAS